MPQSVVAKRPSLERILAGHSQRIRRLEVNHILPAAGTAAYGLTVSIGAADIWTPDFTAAVFELADQIGLTRDGSGVLVPQGWIVWATVIVTIAITDPPAGEGLRWSVSVGEALGSAHSEVLFDGTNDFATQVVAPSGSAASAELPITVTMSTGLGTEFTPLSMDIGAVGIELPVEGFSTGVEG